MITLPNYVKIKNNFCVAYYGNNREYLVQLSLLRPTIESSFPGLQMYIACQDDSIHVLKYEKKVFSRTELINNKNSLSYVKEISDSIDFHPVENLMVESDIEFQNIALTNFPNFSCDSTLKNTGKNDLKRCALLTNGCFPTKSLTGSQIKKAIEIIESNEYSVDINPIDYNEFDAVFGVENEYLYKAASTGIQTILVPTGIGENLFKKLFPNNQIINIYI